MKTKPEVPSQAVADEMAAPAANHAPDIEKVPVPTLAKQGVTSFETLARLRVVDADTGEVIHKVIEADAETGHVVRFAIEGGAMVRENDRFKMIDEKRKVRFEWAVGNQKSSF